MVDRPLFVETTIAATRMFGAREQRRAVEQLLRERTDCQTSHYVREQYRKTFLRVAVIVHSLLHRFEDFATTERAINERPLSTGDQTKAHAILTTLRESHNGDVGAILATLESWIQVRIMSRFSAGLQIKNTTACTLCDLDVKQIEGGTFIFAKSCRLVPAEPCNIDTFWGERRRMLASLAQASLQNGVSKDVKAAKRAAAEVIDGGQPPRGQRCEVHLSDAVIVAQAPENSDIATTDAKDFVPLTAILGGGKRALLPLKELQEARRREVAEAVRMTKGQS